MKKTNWFSPLLEDTLKKNRKMKLTILLFSLALFNANANTSYSQNKKISLSVEKESIEDVLDKIESLSEFKFFYNTDDINVSKEITLNVNKTSIKNILKELFNGNKTSYEVIKNQIVLKNNTKVNDIIQQTIIVKGVITGANGEPIPGASVVEKGTNNGVVSDFDGNFNIKLSSNSSTILVSFIGYKTKEIIIGNQTNFNIQLEEDAASLDEVIIVGYGSTKKSDLTGAVSQVTAESFKDQPLIRLEDALQGRAAGVTVAKSSGSPGAAVKVRIRGANSITGNNDPLVVIDGIIGGDLSTINPNDIASMDVLKDASATAVYGSRGSNGVIMVTTKKGSGKLKVDFDHFTSISEVPKYLDQLSVTDFATIENARRVRVGGSPIFTNAEIDALAQNGGTNYQDEIYQKAISNTTQVSVSGSEGDVRYFLSGNYTKQDGIVINTGYDRVTLRANVNAKVNNKLKVGLNIFTSKSSTKNDLNTYNRHQGSPLLKALTWDPTTPVYDANGNYNLRSIKGIGSLNDNPVFVLKESDFRKRSNIVNSTLNLNYQILDELSYSMIAGSSQTNNSTQNYKVETGDDYLPDTDYSGVDIAALQLSNVLTWQKEFGKHNIKATGVYEFTTSENRTNGYNANGLSLPLGFYRGDDLADASGKNVNNSYTKSVIESYMLRAEYNFNNNLLLTGTVRWDGSSVFPSEKWGTFPSIAVAYNLDDEIKEIANSINGLKLRLGFGQVGNAGIAPYSSWGLLTTNQYAYDGTSPTTGNIITSFENPDLTWETTTQYNAGVDLSFFNNRLNTSIDVYHKKTTDLLLDVPVSDTNGGNNGAISIYSNIGEVENKGLDLSFSGDIINQDEFRWNANLNLSFMKNKVTKLYGGLTELEGTFKAPGGQDRSVNTIMVGKPLGEFLGATFLGTWKTAEATEAATYGSLPGDAKYLRDEDGEILISSIGNGTPTMQWGFNNTFTYNNWDLNVVVQGVHGFDVYNIVQAAITGGAGDSRSFLAAEQVNQWTDTNETEIPAGSTFYNSSRFVEKGDFIRLSNLNIGYTLKEIKGIQSLKIYAGGQNLFLITDYSGYDPEHTSRSADGSGNVDVAAGINTGAYPNPRVYNIGLKATF
ncbi:TonB-linked SusC/RagA family outer membrane protein [Wenyingzhuangia heitensis]|uniref:TonB-linked SusC/RagA family outer membrane protein n=1 Tax=Wenyingzhuangia heitensis TaxID=1487859 RepID=A0ABX0UCG6_9FLAO|nr:TonB-dependent receptor [Wenyingzhuangia heitensis]NIJ46522.1 TonB-linked SusC/RagA family outer membrane protein [Wenyingzhuangia heitensis]